MATLYLCRIALLFVIISPNEVSNYEKILRKIIRNQFKMVQRPFSDPEGQIISWNNSTGYQHLVDSPPEFAQTKMYNKVQRPKVFTVLSMDSVRGKPSSHSKLMSRGHLEKDLRLTRNTLTNSVVSAVQQYSTNEQIPPQSNKSDSTIYDIEPFYRIPPQSKFFPSVEEQDLQSIEPKNDKNIIIPDPQLQENATVYMKSIFMPEKNDSSTALKKPIMPNNLQVEEVEILEVDNDKLDYLLHVSPSDVDSTLYGYNSSSPAPYICKTMREAVADIDAQEMFSDLNIEPHWMTKKHFWNSIYDSRYETLMRNPKWPALKVILVPRTHVDSIWKKSFEQYHEDSVTKILSNVVKKLQFYKNLTFTWNEVSHLSRWWVKIPQKSKITFKKLLNSGRLEITTGGWVETDEATTHLFGLIHILVEGHEWLKSRLNYSPKVAWLTNTVTHSPTTAYLLSILGITQLVITNLHYSWEEFLAEFQYSDFIWKQNWDNDKTAKTTLNEKLKILGNDRYPKHSVFTHYLQFNSAGFRACGPNKDICFDEFNFAMSNKNLDINSFNIKRKSELLLEQYSKTGTISPHNVIIAPIGAPYRYEKQSELDYQYSNYLKIADFVNVNRDIYKATIEFGTPKDYFKYITTKHQYKTLKGDFLNYADLNSGIPAYWVGFFTSRPFFKIMVRRLESTLRTTEILLSFASSMNVFRGYNASTVYETLIKARQNVARLLDRNVATGTLPAKVLRYAHNLVLQTVKDCWRIQELTASFLTSKPGENKSYLKKYVYREGEFISTFRTISPGDQVYVFNSLGHERIEIIELVTRYPNIRVVDFNKKDVTVQINPIWKYSYENVIKISRRFFKVSFVVNIPPMTIELFKIKSTFDAMQSAATIYCTACVIDDIPANDSVFPFNIQPIQSGDIQLESYKHRLIFDEASGFLKTVTEKETSIVKNVLIDFGAFRDSEVSSGMFLFNTNISKPLYDILMPYKIGLKVKATMIISGQITTEISSVYGRLLQHTVRIFNMINSPLSNAIYLESKVDYEMSPKNRNLELFMSIQTGISNGNPPKLFTDNNGFQYTARTLNIGRRIESNMYPITSMAFIQDRRSRLTYVTDHAQGVTSLQEGQLVVMLDRRVLYDDGRGAGEGLADSSATCHRQFILLENFVESEGMSFTKKNLKLPSFSAVYLDNSLNYFQDIFVIDQNMTDLSHYGFLPLIKTAFPCDVSVINYRVVLSGSGADSLLPNTALLILHRINFSCLLNAFIHIKCNGEGDFSLNEILRSVKAVYHTNLAGTNKGIPLVTFSQVNFPPMDITTLRIYF